MTANARKQRSQAHALERLGSFLERHCGLLVDEFRSPRILGKLDGLIAESGGVLGLVERLEGDPSLAQHVVEVLAIHESRFFRHPRHFEYLEQLIRENWGLSTEHRRIWSAACSTGEEPYSIALTVRAALGPTHARRVEILATDLSNAALVRARQSIWSDIRQREIPREYLQQNFLRGVGQSAGTFRANPVLREAVSFQQMNLRTRDWPIGDQFDAVFCRNVLIYFSAKGRAKVTELIADRMRSGGVLFSGPSENMRPIAGKLELVEPSIFRRV